jgi:hypothetical protein
MKRLLVLSVVLGVGVVLRDVIDVVAVRAEAGGGGAGAQGAGAGAGVAGNGDVNGDGNINIADAVALLNWLFLGGPEPVACPAGSGPSGLPDTGQSVCYGFDESQGQRVEVPCAQAACPGQDGAYATGCPYEGRFVDNGDGTVTDNCTGLMWQQATGNGAAPLNWSDALAYCEDLSFAGHDDWRLPNVRELQSLVDYGRLDPAIDPVFGALSSGYWSSTSGAVDSAPSYAWFVYFGIGGVSLDFKFDDFYVRAVRSVP